MSEDVQSEALRQQLLLRALWGQPQAVQSRLKNTGPYGPHGLQAYRANAAALAERALAAAYPTIAALLGAESFAAMARDHWQQHPPERGDVAEWGAHLPDFIARQPALADEPYLPDSARLDWAVHQASRAADHGGPPQNIERLADADPAQLRLTLAPGAALVDSCWPIASIWQAHQHHNAQRFDAVREAFAAQRGESAWVVREGWAVRVQALDDPSAAFMRAVLNGQSLADALEAAGPQFAFDHWLIQALRAGWIQSIASSSPATA
jgi:hypothetical protein